MPSHIVGERCMYQVESGANKWANIQLLGVKNMKGKLMD
jgi:hypothetical protein